MIALLLACASPVLLEVSPGITTNPGEGELAFVLEGPGVVFDYDCDGAQLRLLDADGLPPANLLVADQIVEVWATPSPLAVEGDYTCSISTYAYSSVVEVTIIEL